MGTLGRLRVALEVLESAPLHQTIAPAKSVGTSPVAKANSGGIGPQLAGDQGHCALSGYHLQGLLEQSLVRLSSR